MTGLYGILSLNEISTGCCLQQLVTDGTPETVPRQLVTLR